MAGIFAVEKGWVQFPIILRPDNAYCMASDFLFLCALFEITLLESCTGYRITSQCDELTSVLAQTNIHRPVTHITPPEPSVTWPFL